MRAAHKPPNMIIIANVKWKVNGYFAESIFNKRKSVFCTKTVYLYYTVFRLEKMIFWMYYIDTKR